MVCIYCGSATRVINSRHQKRRNRVWRRRHCPACGSLFTTEESALYEAAWLVTGTKGRLEPFSRDKLLLSLLDACGHRKAALRDAQGLTDTVITKLSATVKNGSLAKSHITRAALVALNRFDKAAGVHYEARHRG